MIELTMLNSMAGSDFAAALAQHRAWGLRCLDLKDSILGKGLLDLSLDEARAAAALIRTHETSVYCFSTTLFVDDIEMGRAAFAATLSGKIRHAIALAGVLKPKVIRLLAARTSKRAGILDAIVYVRQNHPWLLDLYRAAIDELHAAGWAVTIENECHDCILGRPEEVCQFFTLLDRPGRVTFTWDVQNMWQMGTFPTLAAYQPMRDLISYYHVKGGQCRTPGGRLEYRSALEDASWPVAQITRQVSADGRVPMICLNPPHGGAKPGAIDSDITARDVRFVQQLLGERP